MGTTEMTSKEGMRCVRSETVMHMRVCLRQPGMQTLTASAKPHR